MKNEVQRQKDWFNRSRPQKTAYMDKLGELYGNKPGNEPAGITTRKPLDAQHAPEPMETQAQEKESHQEPETASDDINGSPRHPKPVRGHRSSTVRASVAEQPDPVLLDSQ